MLNQYTAKENNLLRVSGTAAQDAKVAVGGTSALAAKVERAWATDLLPNNATHAVKGSATIYAGIAGQGGALDIIRKETKPFFLPKALQSFTYDADGRHDRFRGRTAHAVSLRLPGSAY